MKGSSERPKQLLSLPFSILLHVSEHLSFSSLWCLSSTSQQCRKLGHQLILHKYQIDLSKPQLNRFDHLIYSALAYIGEHGYHGNQIDTTIIQSTSNRLAVEIYDRSPLKNWEQCLDYLLDKALGIIVDHAFLDLRLDVIPKHISSKEFQPTKMSGLISSFLNTLYPTLIALFETEPTSKIHHRLLLNHINRHFHHVSTNYHQLYYRRLYISSSPNTKRTTITAANEYNSLLRLNFRILVRFIGTLVQTDLLSITDLETLAKQQIQHFVHSEEKTEPHPKRRRLKMNTQTNTGYHQQLEEIEFQMELFSDLTRAVLLLQQQTPSNNGLSTVSNMLHDTVSGLRSSKNISSNSA
ncbi:hypothetical protein BY458DRAFT_518577 [Sporodiniella umbellata]|nr:hypothetical protein BY458DRAFT_518577 [Sporodiniella umbellata]